MKNNKYLIGGIVVLVLLIGAFMLGKGGTNEAQAQGKLEVAETHYDFGTIGLDNVTYPFTVRNVGAGPLTIERVSTSCGCTTAQLKQGNKTSVQFGMDHGNLPKANMTLQPGEETEVLVTYHPLAHGLNNAAGHFRRIVYIQTSNPKEEHELTVEMTVDPDKKTIKEAQIEFDKQSYDFGQIPKEGGVVETTFTVFNRGGESLTISDITTSCGCTSAEIASENIQPNGSTKLTVRFDPDFHDEPQGKLERTITLFTNDPNNKEANVEIYAEIIE